MTACTIHLPRKVDRRQQSLSTARSGIGVLTEGHLLEYNPFTERFVAKQREVETIEDEKRECSRQFVWYSNFNLDAEAETLASSKRQAVRIAFQIERFKKERI